MVGVTVPAWKENGSCVLNGSGGYLRMHTHTHTGLHHCWHVHLAPSKRGAQLLLQYCPLLDTELPEVRIHDCGSGKPSF